VGIYEIQDSLKTLTRLLEIEKPWLRYNKAKERNLGFEAADLCSNSSTFKIARRSPQTLHRPSHANTKPKNAVVCSVSTDVILEGTLSFVVKEY
jgi:hypothetical protein